MGRHTQVGLVAAASCEEYLDDTIKKHEFTRPDKEDDRVRHIEALNSQTGPVFLTYRASAAIDEFVARRIAGPPGVDFTAKDGVRHTSWPWAMPQAWISSSGSSRRFRLFTSRMAIIAARRRGGFISHAAARAGAAVSSPSFFRTTRCRSCPTTAC